MGVVPLLCAAVGNTWGFQRKSCAFLVLLLRAKSNSLARTCKFSGSASVHSVETVDFFDGMRGLDCSIEKLGSRRHFFKLRKNARFGLRSEIALFDPPIRLHNNWPNKKRKTKKKTQKGKR